MIRGETVSSGAPLDCGDEGCPSPDGPKVLCSGAGYYIGYFCDLCGPYSRESLGYYATTEQAETALAEGWPERTTEFRPSSVCDTGQADD